MKKQLEIWKKSMENRDSVYYVSNMGRCRKVSKSTGDETITKGRLNRQIGYYSINNNYVHRLVAEQFLGPKPAWAEQVDHINSDKTDNRAENLRWVTRKENNSTDHAKTMHRLNANSRTGGGQVIRAVKGEQELFFKNGREAARALGCSHVLVYNCLNRRGSAKRAKGWELAWTPLGGLLEGGAK